MACQAIANTVKNSLGPVGLDKMLVDDIGDVTITNDGATILKMLEVEHPAAEVLVELAELQDHEVGDGTASVVIIAAELLKLAMREACKYIDDKLAIKVVDAVLAVKTTNDKGEIEYPIKAINILKAHGKSAKGLFAEWLCPEHWWSCPGNAQACGPSSRSMLGCQSAADNNANGDSSFSN
ncbi:unnamed protein product [Sphagnum troendelagicum]